MVNLRHIGLLIFLCSCGQLEAQDKTPAPFDGPYVRYNVEQISVTNIMEDDDLFIPVAENYRNKRSFTLNVLPEGHTEWAFTVRLRDALTNDPTVYPATGKCLFISDIEGEFANFRKLLIAACVIDEHYNWRFGPNTLVIPGDLFDRGRDVVPELWLLYKLEDEARAAGGQMIVILGNHDIFNLSGDHRYTDGKYFKDAWLMKTDINSLFDRGTELGRWLRKKNVIAKVGDVLVMHGGLSPIILQKHLDLEQLNAACRPWYDVPRKNIPDSLQLFFGKDALFWYRGYFIEPKATTGLIAGTLKQYQAKYILVGHTIVKWNIANYYCGKVIGVDTDEHSGNTRAALYENGKWSVIDDQGNHKPLVYKSANDLITEKDIL